MRFIYTAIVYFSEVVDVVHRPKEYFPLKKGENTHKIKNKSAVLAGKHVLLKLCALKN